MSMTCPCASIRSTTSPRACPDAAIVPAFRGMGVQPHVAVVRTVADLQAGRDATLDRAVAQLLQRRPTARTVTRNASP
jgi:hypothetical protein